MGKIIKIYCEGKRGSHDYDIIEKVIDGLTGILIEPIGGKRGAKSAIQVFEKLVVKSDHKIFFRDRDFDAPVPEKEELINKDSYVYLSYKTTIENYLLDIDLFLDFIPEKFGNKETIIDKFINAARTIKHHQAVRHTLGVLRVPTDFGSNICESSGILPTDLSYDFCRSEGIKKVLEGKAKTDTWTESEFDNQLNYFEDVFDEDFFENMDFLNWFQGKDLAKALVKEFEGFPIRKFYSYSKKHFDYTKFKDLVELRLMIENYG